MKKELFKFQSEALNTVKNEDNALLCWGMGTGKTISSIALAEHWGSEILVCLVLKSTVSQWIEALNEQTDRKVYNGYKKTKKDGIEPFIQCSERKALVIGYDAFKTASSCKLRDYVSKNERSATVICDESSLIGHMESARTKAVMKTKSKHKMMLSGTPATGGKMEALLPTMNMLGWKMTKKEFLKQYCDVYEWIDPTRPWLTIPIIRGYRNLDKLREGLKQHGTSFMTMEDAGVELPETSEQTLDISVTSEYKKFMKNSIVTVGGRELIGENALTKMLYARQLCSVYNGEKMSVLKELLMQSGDEPVLVFYNWTAELDTLKKLCDELERPICTVNGQGKDLRAYEQNRPGTVILAQYQAASMGLNLQKCNICIFYSLCLSYSDYEQAKARIHRIGQNRHCSFYKLICTGSIEEHIMETLEQRQDYTEQLYIDKYMKRKATR